MLVKKIDKNCCMFRVTYNEIHAVGWSVDEIMCHKEQSKSLSEIMDLLVKVFTSHVDASFVVYANIRFQGLPLCVDWGTGQDFIDFKVYIPCDCNDVFFMESDTEIRPLWEYLKHYGVAGKDEAMPRPQDVIEDDTSDDADLDDAEYDEEDDKLQEYEEVKDCSNIIYFNNLDSVILFCKIIVSRKLPDFNSKLFKLKDGHYALLCGFPGEVSKKILRGYDMVIAEFANGMVFDEIKS